MFVPTNEQDNKMRAVQQQKEEGTLSKSEKIVTALFFELRKEERTRITQAVAEHFPWKSGRDYVRMVMRGDRYNARCYIRVAQQMEDQAEKDVIRLNQLIQALQLLRA